MTNRNNKSGIIIIISSILGGGASKIVVTLHNQLTKHIDVELVQVSETIENSFNSTNVNTLISTSNKLSDKTWYKLPVTLVKFLKLCYNNKIKLVLPIDPWLGIISIISSYLHNHKTLVSIHSMPSFSETTLDSYARKILYVLIRIKKIPVVAVSNGVKEELTSLCHINSEQITVIHNPIDISTIKKKGEETVNLPQQMQGIKNPILISIGRLVDVKGHKYLIRIFAELQKTNPSYLMILGTGPNEQYLRNLTKRYNLSERVFFMGWQENPYKYIAKSKVLVHSSLSESFGNVIVEAMALGCPVVSTRCSPSIEEIMGTDNACGFISKEISEREDIITETLDESELDFLNKIQTILDNPEMYEKMSCACLERAKLFDVNVGVQKYVRIIEKSMTTDSKI